MKLISKFVERGPTCIVRLIVTGKPLILCCQNAAILLPLGVYSNVPLVPMAFKQFAIDKSGANLAGLLSPNVILKFTVVGRIIGIVQSKYLNNIVEQDHRFIKRITRPMLGFKAFHSAAATLAGIGNGAYEPQGSACPKRHPGVRAVC
jgi:hypothetical protein